MICPRGEDAFSCFGFFFGLYFCLSGAEAVSQKNNGLNNAASLVNCLSEPISFHSPDFLFGHTGRGPLKGHSFDVSGYKKNPFPIPSNFFLLFIIVDLIPAFNVSAIKIAMKIEGSSTTPFSVDHVLPCPSNGFHTK